MLWEPIIHFRHFLLNYDQMYSLETVKVKRLPFIISSRLGQKSSMTTQHLSIELSFSSAVLCPLNTHSTVAHYFLRGYFYLEMMVKSLINWSWTQTPACSSKDTKLYLVSWNCIVLFSKVFIRAQVFKSSACDIFETGRPSTKTYSTQAP